MNEERPYRGPIRYDFSGESRLPQQGVISLTNPEWERVGLSGLAYQKWRELAFRRGITNMRVRQLAKDK